MQSQRPRDLMEERIVELLLPHGETQARAATAPHAHWCQLPRCFAHVWRVARRYDLRHVFLATDDEAVVGEARRTFDAGPTPLRLLSPFGRTYTKS